MSKSKLLLLLAFSTLVAYGASIRYGFSQDDWFHLSISQANSLADFLNFFNPAHVTWIFFRPLSTQVPYWFATSLFSLSGAPYFMHALMLVIQVINAYLVVRIARKYLKDPQAVTLGIIYSLSTLHFLSLFYIGAIQQLISTCFSLLAIYHFISLRRKSQWILAILTLCALLSKELALRLPLTLLVLSYLQDRKIWPSLSRVAGPLIVTILYFAMRYLVGTTGASQYALDLGLGTTLASLMWYGLFLLGFPESLLQHGLSQGRIDFLTFAQQSGPLSWFIILGSIVILYFATRRAVQLIYSRSWWELILLPVLALLSILPVLFLPTHRYPHYLDLAILAIGVWVLQGVSTIDCCRSKIILGVICLGMLSGIVVETRTHWTIKRALISEEIIAQMKQSGACTSPDGVVFTGTSLEMRELGYALSQENGPRIICQNPALPVYYKELP